MDCTHTCAINTITTMTHYYALYSDRARSKIQYILLNRNGKQRFNVHLLNQLSCCQTHYLQELQTTFGGSFQDHRTLLITPSVTIQFTTLYSDALPTAFKYTPCIWRYNDVVSYWSDDLTHEICIVRMIRSFHTNNCNVRSLFL